MMNHFFIPPFFVPALAPALPPLEPAAPFIPAMMQQSNNLNYSKL